MTRLRQMVLMHGLTIDAGGAGCIEREATIHMGKEATAMERRA